VLAVFVALLTYLTYSGITGFLVREVVNIPVIQDFTSQDRIVDNVVDIPQQVDSNTQKTVDKFMQEFNIPLAKKDQFVQQAKDVINRLDEPDYQIVPPAQEKKDQIPPEGLNECFERVIVECS